MSAVDVVAGLAGLAEFEAYHGWVGGSAFDVERMGGGEAVLRALKMGVRFHRLFATEGLSVLREDP